MSACVRDKSPVNTSGDEPIRFRNSNWMLCRKRCKVQCKESVTVVSASHS